MIQIENLIQSDWDAVRSMYIESIATGMATFETAPPSWEEWDASHLPNCRLVVKDGPQIIDWAASSSVPERSVYEGIPEVSIYLSNSSQGKGVGKLLLTSLIELSEREGIWTLEGTMFPENKASIQLHRSCGFRKVGYREKIGRLNVVWRDTILMQRRNKIPRRT